MMLTDNLEKMERFAAKIWRVHSKEDPISQLSFNEYDYLKVIQLSPEPIRLTDLAQQMEVTKPSATNMVNRLERKGLVKRKACLEDARAKKIELTDKAVIGLLEESRVYKIMSQGLEKKLSDEELEQLNLLLTKALK